MTIADPDISTPAEAEPKKVRVELGARGYDIVIGEGLLARVDQFLGPLLRRPRAFVVTDDTVSDLHLATLRGALDTAGVSLDVHQLPPGEATKSFQHLEGVLDAFMAAGAERDDLIIAFGGGVVGDLTGLAAGLLKRGARFVQIPTTLLAQVDSSVGGKTAINSTHGKNLVGLFYQPSLVLADLNVLQTLPERQLQAGLAEVVKYALIDDPKFFEFLNDNVEALAAGDAGALAEAVRVSCEAKARIVSEDETERGARALLNLGHTFGHALERANRYGAGLLHGEAVACGMAMAFRYSVQLGLCPSEDADRAEKLLNALGLKTRISDLEGGPYEAEALLAHMAHDKKAKAGALTLILAKGVGQSFIQPNADITPLLDFLRQETA
ncbi:MAG: 3-dehydroquinate synthase [Pseudomonadota bacterium]